MTKKTTPPAQEPKNLTPPEAAKFLGIHPVTLEAIVGQGRLTPERNEEGEIVSYDIEQLKRL